MDGTLGTISFFSRRWMVPRRIRSLFDKQNNFFFRSRGTFLAPGNVFWCLINCAGRGIGQWKICSCSGDTIGRSEVISGHPQFLEIVNNAMVGPENDF